jgi:hypothetical protein
VNREDERPHTPGEDSGWSESWAFDFATADAALGGFVRLTLRPHDGVCWYWAYLVGAGRDPVLVVDDEVPLPRNRSLEIRAEGLWADHIVEEPLDHLSVGCEAFALRLDDPADAFGKLWGERVGFGLDLGWETDSEPRPRPQTAAAGYDVPCEVVGEVLVGEERIELDAHGWRSHIWGPTDPWATGWAAVGGRWEDGTWLAPADAASGDVRVAVDVRAFAPLVVPGPAGVRSRLLSGLCQLRDLGKRRSGAGWLVWNQPESATNPRSDGTNPQTAR